MMDLKEFKYYLDMPCGIRYMFDTLDTSSTFSKRFMSEKRIMTDAVEIEAYYRILGAYLALDPASGVLHDVSVKLSGIRDIRNTISRLASGTVLDDVELFEIKSLAILNEEVRLLLKDFPYNSLPSSETVLAILDPSGNRALSFYIYDSYSEELRAARKRLSSLDEGEEHDRAFAEVLLIEDSVRKNLCKSLSVNSDVLSKSLHELADIDVFIAKARQIRTLGLCFPRVSDRCMTVYKGMFNPKVRSVLVEKGKVYVPVDVKFGRETVSVIGANMGGKTVAIKTVALNQILFQYGFGIPAFEAEVDIKNDILLSIGDEQNDSDGLSSFAAEMKSIDLIIKKTDKSGPVLAVIDEPARTTNPVEGTALVEALVTRLRDSGSSVLLTTHYNIKNDRCRRYRVKGYRDGRMDYRLEESTSSDVPMEALDIAKSLSIDTEWINIAGLLLN